MKQHRRLFIKNMVPVYSDSETPQQDLLPVRIALIGKGGTGERTNGRTGRTGERTNGRTG